MLAKYDNNRLKLCDSCKRGLEVVKGEKYVNVIPLQNAVNADLKCDWCHTGRHTLYEFDKE